MYHYGGVYLDIKSTTKVPLSSVLKDDDSFILCQWSNQKNDSDEGWGLHPQLTHIKNGEFQQWHIICQPKHPFLKAVIEKVITNIIRYKPNTYPVGFKGVLQLTGPIPYTLAIEPLLKEYQPRHIKNHRNLGLQYSIFSNKGEHTKILTNHYSLNTVPIIKPKSTNITMSMLTHSDKNITMELRTALSQFKRPSKKPKIIVVSFERSGTHFLMNSLSKCFNYVSDPWINMDYFPEATFFYDKGQVEEYFSRFKDIPVSNLVKSHHSIDFFQNTFKNLTREFTFLYIYRHPLDVLRSLWHMVNKMQNNEGTLCETFSGFIRSQPEGKLLRYQIKQEENMVYRWNSHVSGWLNASLTHPNIHLVSYKELNENYKQAIMKIANHIQCEPYQIVKPEKTEKVILETSKNKYSKKYSQEDIDFVQNITKSLQDNLNI